jgi:RNA polymerase sigma factor (sigma-70 family)
MNKLPKMAQKNSYSLSFKPKAVVKKLLAVLDDRSQDVIVGRFGLGKETKKRTLESIGEQYDITRERVRQIENSAIKTIQQHEITKKKKMSLMRLRPS